MGCVQIFFCFLVVMIIICSVGLHSGESDTARCKFLHFDNEGDNKTTEYKPVEAYLSTHRKLMLHGICSNRDISISQSRYSTSGIPQYVVQIVNTCVSGCAPSNIHLHCGWFASARIVNPRSFKRISYDDCLVNGGRPLKNSQIIRFSYANSFMYPLELKTANFC